MRIFLLVLALVLLPVLAFAQASVQIGGRVTPSSGYTQVHIDAQGNLYIVDNNQASELIQSNLLVTQLCRGCSGGRERDSSAMVPVAGFRKLGLICRIQVASTSTWSACESTLTAAFAIRYKGGMTSLADSNAAIIVRPHRYGGPGAIAGSYGTLAPSYGAWDTIGTLSPQDRIADTNPYRPKDMNEVIVTYNNVGGTGDCTKWNPSGKVKAWIVETPTGAEVVFPYFGIDAKHVQTILDDAANTAAGGTSNDKPFQLSFDLVGWR